MAPGKEHMGLVINQASFLTFTKVPGLPHLETQEIRRLIPSYNTFKTLIAFPEDSRTNVTV